MSREIVVRAEALGKKYVIGHAEERERYLALRDAMMRTAGNLWRRTLDIAKGRPIIGGDITEEFWALRNVDFEIRQGEVVGVIGRNGAGKTTLLKILSRITEPTAGRVTITGRVASLLEVGTGFHPELTGRENIFLNGAILGMSRAEIRRHFDEIVAFAEVERFLDTPVKKYSSGMYVRLAFAVAAHLETDIVIVDEVLAVGDAAFQKKCLGKMGDVSSSGRTVLFVSHNIGALHSVCQKGLLLADGSLAATGSIGDVIRKYYELDKRSPSIVSRALFKGPLDSLVIETIELNGAPLAYQNIVNPDERVTLTISGKNSKYTPNFRFALVVSCEGVRVFTVQDGPEGLPEGAFEVLVEIPRHFLRPNSYFLSFGGRCVDGGGDWIWGEDIAFVNFIEQWGNGYERDNVGLVNVKDVTFTRHMSAPRSTYLTRSRA
jgi:ABC-type polysaccharide/polyol phosphate transport system ATPase subunit